MITPTKNFESNILNIKKEEKMKSFIKINGGLIELCFC